MLTIARHCRFRVCIIPMVIAKRSLPPVELRASGAARNDNNIIMFTIFYYFFIRTRFITRRPGRRCTDACILLLPPLLHTMLLLLCAATAVWFTCVMCVCDGVWVRVCACVRWFIEEKDGDGFNVGRGTLMRCGGGCVWYAARPSRSW